MIKIVVADMDGTSLGPNEAISEKNIKTILKVIDSGRDFVFASGRPTFGMNGIIKKAGLEEKINYFIAYNGGIVYDVQKDKNIYMKNIDFKIIREIYNIILENNIDISFCLHEKNLIYITQDNKELEVEVESNNQTKVFIENIDDLKGKRKENLEKEKESAFLCIELATVHRDLEEEYDKEKLIYESKDKEK